MGIQINGNTNNINAGIGSLSIEDLNELDIVGVATAANFKTGVSNLHSVGLTLSGGQIDVGSNIKLGNAGVITATSFSGSGANLSSLPSQITFNNASADRVLTSNGGTAVNAEANLTMTGNNLQFNTTANGHAVKLVAAGNHYNLLTFDSGNTSAGGELAYIDFKWDGDKVADIQVLAGSDTTNKDDGHLVFRTSPSQGSITERLRITSAGEVGIGTAIPVVASGYGNLSLAGNNGGQLELKQVTSDIRHYIWGNQNLNIGGGYTNGSTSNIRFLCNGATERLKITSTGILVTGNGTAPNSTDVGSIFMPGGADLGWLTSSGSITFNSYYSGGWKYVTTGTSHILWGDSGGFNFSTASSGSANGAISYSRAMKIHTNNRISIGDGNSTTPLGALHINTKSTMGTDTALYIGSNSDNRYMTINQVSNSEQFSHMDLVFNDNGSRSMINLKNPYGPAGYGSAITWKGYNNGDQGYIECKSENANSSVATMYLNSSSGTFLQGNSSRHVTMPQQPSFAASRTGGNVGNGNTIVFNSVKFNVGSHYNNSNGRFTAPTAGKYQFSFGGMAYGGSGDFQVRILKNGSNYFNSNGSGRGHSTFEPYGFTVLMDMAVGDYAHIAVYSSMSAVIYGTGTVWNIFSGHLVS